MRRYWVAALGLATMLPQSARADPDSKTAEALERARQAYSLPTREQRCQPKAGSDEIVVCADHGEDQRIPSSTDSVPNSRAALRDGRPHAPDFEPHYPGPVVASGCFLQPCPKTVYYFDIKALPEAPAGSEAETVGGGNGEPP